MYLEVTSLNQKRPGKTLMIKNLILYQSLEADKAFEDTKVMLKYYVHTCAAAKNKFNNSDKVRGKLFYYSILLQRMKAQKNLTQ